MNKRCIGCGKIMQMENKNLPGYTPDLKMDYCRRCFRLKNYGEKKEDIVNEEEIINKINKRKGIAFFLVDYLNINKETVSIFEKIKIPKVLVISKSDTLRKEMKPEKIAKWLNRVYHIKEKVLFISSKPYYQSSNIFKAMDEQNDNTAYILGITNAGKSTFINKILKENNIKKELLASNKPNTTLDFIKIKVGAYTLYDTPGFSYKNNHEIAVEKEIKPISYQVKKGTKLKVANYEFYFEENNKVTYYGKQEIKRTFQEIKNPIALNIEENQDIVIPGIGYLNIKEKGMILTNKEGLEVRMDESEDVI